VRQYPEVDLILQDNVKGVDDSGNVTLKRLSAAACNIDIAQYSREW
jgi:hypothetical protein